MKVTITHTEPAISPKKPTPALMKREWFVWVRFYNPDKDVWTQERFKKGINSIDDFTERVKAIIKLQKVVKKDIEEDGYHPYIKAEPLAKSKTFSEGLDFALANCNVSDNTYKNYRLCIKYIKGAAESLRMSNASITTIKRKAVKQLLQECRKTLKWSDHAYNKYLGYLQALLSVLVEWEEIEYNPAHKIKKIEIEETQKFVPLTEKEREKIKEYLFLHDYRFFVFCMAIFHCGLRPMEILALKIKDIDFEKRLIIILPNKQRKNSKTKKKREVPLNDFIFRFLREHLDGYENPELFVFGSPFQKGLGNRGTGSPDDMFKPSLTRIKRDTVTRRWETVVIKELKISKHLYALKHSGANSKIAAGVSIDALQSMYGHSSKLMTLKYISNIKEIYKKEIIDKSPDF